MPRFHPTVKILKYPGDPDGGYLEGFSTSVFPWSAARMQFVPMALWTEDMLYFYDLQCISSVFDQNSKLSQPPCEPREKNRKGEGAPGSLELVN